MKNKDLYNITKKTGFKTPDNYFNTFEEQLFNTLESKSSMQNIESHGFNVPQNYFETLDEKLESLIHSEKESKVIKVNWKRVVYTTSIAACLVLIFSLGFNNSKNITFESIETASIETYIQEEDYTSYEIASLLDVAELETENFTDKAIPDSDLENYLLEHSTLEDLIIE